MDTLCSEPTHNIQAYDSQVLASNPPLSPTWAWWLRGGDLCPSCKLDQSLLPACVGSPCQQPLKAASWSHGQTQGLATHYHAQHDAT